MPFEFNIPDRSYWLDKPEACSESLEIFTDGSKLNERVGCGIFIGKLNRSMSYRLPDSCSVFQAEVTAILLAVRWLLNSKIFPETILIYSDSQAAIKSLASVATTSKLVLECRASLKEMSKHSKINLTWVPGHRDIPGNCTADELARAGTQLPAILPSLGIGTPITTMKHRIRRSYQELAQKSWESEGTCSVAKTSWTYLNPSKTKDLRPSVVLTYTGRSLFLQVTALLEDMQKDLEHPPMISVVVAGQRRKKRLSFTSCASVQSTPEQG